MSGGDKSEISEVNAEGVLEDFSPTAGETSGPGPTVVELVSNFQLMGVETDNIIEKVAMAMDKPSERLVSGALVEQGFLSEEEMESMVLARYLLAVGKITLTQLELVMDEIKDTKAPLWVSLVAKGWLKMSDVV